VRSCGGRRRGRWSAAALTIALLAPADILSAESLKDPASQRDAPSTAAPEGGTAGGDLTEMSIEQLMRLEVATVYGASKYLQKVTDAPALVTIVTADEIRRLGYRTLAEVLRSVGGFHITNDRNYSYVGVRGFGRPSDYNNRVLLLVDGHRLNDNVYDAAPIGTEFPLDVDLIDRVEVIRGPSSSVYGNNAFLAVVNVITRRASGIAPLEVAGSAGSYDTYSGRATYAVTLPSGLEAVLSASLYDSAGHRSLFYREFDDPATNNGIARKADDDTAYSLFGSFSLGGFTLQGLVGSREKGIPTASFDTVFNDSRTRTTDIRGYVDLRYERTFADGLGLLARVYYDRMAYYGRYAYDVSETDEPALLVNKDTSAGEWVGTELQLTRTFWQRLKLTAGAEYQYHFRQEQKNYDALGTHLSDERTSTWWALYAQADVTLHPKLLLSLGGRFDQYESFGGTLSPRLGLIYHPVERTTLKLLYGEAFRAPNVYELYYSADPQKANPALHSESIQTFEVILEHYLTRQLRATAAAFHNQIDDLINQEVDPADQRIVFRNLDQATAKGIEVGLEGRLPWWGIEGRASYTLQETRDDRTDRLLTNSPRHLVKLALIVPLYRDWASLGTEVQYTGARQTLAGAEADGYWLTNLTLLSQRLYRGLTVSVSVYNLFDQRYGDPGAQEHRQDVIEQDGRSFRLKVIYRF
jgi:iron complex outermembrane receptor protein